LQIKYISIITEKFSVATSLTTKKNSDAIPLATGKISVATEKNLDCNISYN
jgi:hypothetical protein